MNYIDADLGPIAQSYNARLIAFDQQFPWEVRKNNPVLRSQWTALQNGLIKAKEAQI